MGEMICPIWGLCASRSDHAFMTPPLLCRFEICSNLGTLVAQHVDRIDHGFLIALAVGLEEEPCWVRRVGLKEVEMLWLCSSNHSRRVNDDHEAGQLETTSLYPCSTLIMDSEMCCQLAVEMMNSGDEREVVGDGRPDLALRPGVVERVCIIRIS